MSNKVLYKNGSLYLYLSNPNPKKKKNPQNCNLPNGPLMCPKTAPWWFQSSLMAVIEAVKNEAQCEWRADVWLTAEGRLRSSETPSTEHALTVWLQSERTSLTLWWCSSKRRPSRYTSHELLLLLLSHIYTRRGRNEPADWKNYGLVFRWWASAAIQLLLLLVVVVVPLWGRHFLYPAAQGRLSLNTSSLQRVKWCGSQNKDAKCCLHSSHKYIFWR